MPTTTITVASFQDACAECADAIADESWATASKWYARAEAINAGLELATEKGDYKFQRRESLRGLQQAIAVAEGVTQRFSDVGRFITTKTGFG